MAERARKPFLIIAHRGASNHAPENTISAFDRALEMGFHHVELDAQLSSDGVAVVFHDGTLERTTDGSGPLAGCTLAQLKGLDAGSWFDQAFGGERIPTLGELLLRYRGRAYLHLELKSEEERLPGIVAELLVKAGWPTEEKVEPASGQSWPTFGVAISSFHKAQLDRMRPLLPQMPLAWLVQELSFGVLDESESSGFQAVCPRAQMVTEGAVADAKRRGLRVRAWGLRSSEELGRLVDCGVEGTTCDWPDEAREYLVGLGIPTFS